MASACRRGGFLTRPGIGVCRIGSGETVYSTRNRVCGKGGGSETTPLRVCVWWLANQQSWARIRSSWQVSSSAWARSGRSSKM